VSRRVLIADFNVDAAESLAFLLEIHGHRVVTAHTGPDVLEMALRIVPEAAFLSLHLPHLSGLEVCRRMCEGIVVARPPVLVALTGDGSDRARELSRHAGFDYHILKPADPAHILTLLR
jgi:DNA-binding response OmpR family regulator